MRRNTIQRSIVLNTVKQLKNHPTADEVYSKINLEHPNISKGTVYRNLNCLADAGEISVRELPGQPCHFDHRTDKHYHIKCVKCKKIFDVDMEVIEDLEQKIKDKHGFEFIGYDVVFSGICPECSKISAENLAEKEKI